MRKLVSEQEYGRVILYPVQCDMVVSTFPRGKACSLKAHPRAARCVGRFPARGKRHSRCALRELVALAGPANRAGLRAFQVCSRNAAWPSG